MWSPVKILAKTWTVGPTVKPSEKSLLRTGSLILQKNSEPEMGIELSSVPTENYRVEPKSRTSQVSKNLEYKDLWTYQWYNTLTIVGCVCMITCETNQTILSQSKFVRSQQTHHTKTPNCQIEKWEPQWLWTYWYISTSIHIPYTMLHDIKKPTGTVVPILSEFRICILVWFWGNRSGQKMGTTVVMDLLIYQYMSTYTI